MYSMYVLYKIKKHIFTSKLFGCIKTFKTKKVLNIFQFFVYRVRGAMVGRNFLPIGEYSSTVKNRQKRASVHRRVGLKRLKENMSAIPNAGRVVDILRKV
jgi:hypothetical protein